jgi:hypothetical protein
VPRQNPATRGLLKAQYWQGEVSQGKVLLSICYIKFKKQEMSFRFFGCYRPTRVASTNRVEEVCNYTDFFKFKKSVRV